MSQPSQAKPQLADLVRSGDAQTAAIEITPFIFMSRDASNSYLVTTTDGDIVINTGMPDGAERSVSLFAPKRTGALRHIILTQSHGDHFGGVPAFLETETTIIGGPGYIAARDDMLGLQSYFAQRTMKLWGATLKRDTPRKPMPDVTPDIFVKDTLSLKVGQRTFVLIHAPEGETEDNILVWMSEEKILFTGNTFGPVWLSMPFLNTLRGDKPRRVRTFLQTLEKVRALGAEILITGHGEPIYGKEQIKADLDRIEAAVRYVRDYTLEGMKAGKTVHQLMNEFTFPENIRIGEFHGKGSWAVKSIWREYSGWLHYEDGTTELYGTPRSAIHEDIIELTGGIAPLSARAREKLDSGQPLEALHLVDIVLGVEPQYQDALTVKRDANQLLLDRSGGQNFSETMWLRAEISDAKEGLKN